MRPPSPFPDRPRLRRSRRHEWRPLTEGERRWLGEVLALCGLGPRRAGRPSAHGAVARLEACLEAAARGLPWREARSAAAPGLAPEALRRCFLRWARRGVFAEMLRAMRFAGAPSAAMEWFACLAYRRAWRAQGREGVALARRCGFASALRAPPSWMPDPDMSAWWWQEVIRPLALPLERMCAGMCRLVGAMARLGRVHHGVRRIPAWAKAGW
ncbi:hypothetical protein ACI6QG_07470 [Roseococcus sp. DSY-14]|uniref:hypothetical protein n=1 Tax=Roseococcus sp. DSY-14 TaxID=3369650 RepID=UPI00387B4E2B